MKNKRFIVYYLIVFLSLLVCIYTTYDKFEHTSYIYESEKNIGIDTINYYNNEIKQAENIYKKNIGDINLYKEELEDYMIANNEDLVSDFFLGKYRAVNKIYISPVSSDNKPVSKEIIENEKKWYANNERNKIIEFRKDSIVINDKRTDTETVLENVKYKITPFLAYDNENVISDKYIKYKNLDLPNINYSVLVNVSPYYQKGYDFFIKDKNNILIIKDSVLIAYERIDNFNSDLKGF